MRARLWVFAGIAVALGAATFKFPDVDLLISPGIHRYFLVHSAIVPLLAWMALRERRWFLGAAACGFALGVGAHLVTDLFQAKSVSFWPLAGTLVYGTSLDDRLWEGGNAAACAWMAWSGWRRARKEIEA